MDNSLDTTKENKRLLDEEEGSGFLPEIVQPNAQTIVSQDSDEDSEDEEQDFEEFVRNKQNGFKPKALKNQTTMQNVKVKETIEEDFKIYPEN